jgi:hypothetical protein
MRPALTSRSSGAASSAWAAIASIFARTVAAASVAAPLTSTALRLPPVPGPDGVASVSPWMTVTTSMSTPSWSATTWATVVSTLWPWLALLMSACTSPLTPMLTMAASLARLPMATPDGATYRPNPTPSRRP